MIVEDDPTARRLLRHWLEQAGFRVLEHSSGGSALGETETPLVACVDLGLDDVPGMTVIRHLHATQPELAVIVVTAKREIETAVEAMRAGAYDYVTKPFERDRLMHAVRRASERTRLLRDVRRLETALDAREVLGTIIGDSAPMRELAHQVERVLHSDVAVCLYGESGTGKELVARAIHKSGQRKSGPFVAINCAAIPESLQESELFGHERGAFTGATNTRRGRFEEARGGTLFLDEIGEMSPATQAALLRTLQERTVRRVGGSEDIPVDARIVCATHRDLRAEVAAGRFREDLYFRLVVYPIVLPPLRERREDIPLLVGHFLRTLGERDERRIERISADALEALQRHAWPGNVRELMNVVHRSMLACPGDEIRLADLPPDLRALPRIPPRHTPEPPAPQGNEVVPLRELERRAIQHALRVADGSVGKAAKLLGIGRATLYRRIAVFENAMGSA